MGRGEREGGTTGRGERGREGPWEEGRKGKHIDKKSHETSNSYEVFITSIHIKAHCLYHNTNTVTQI